jgi:folylpolyglutamate synthase/dihydropteroate synthase
LTVVTESLGTLDWPESENAALALAAFQQWHTLHGEPMVLNRSTAESILTTTKIPGRKQIVRDNLGVTWFLDGAHTVESLQTVADWLIKVCNPKESTLLFFCGPDRDWDRLYSTITHLNFQKVLFLYPEAYRHLYESSQRSFREIPVTSLVEWLENSGIETKSVVVTGSFYIVGDVLRYLQTQQ